MNKIVVSLVCAILAFSIFVFIDERVYAQDTDGYAYAILTDDRELIFFRSEESYSASIVENATVTDIVGNSYAGTLFTGIEDKWYGARWNNDDYRTTIKTIYVAEGQTIRPRSLDGWFSGCSRLEELNLINFDFSSVTDMSWLFSGCESLEELDLSGFVTNNVTDMEGMFSGCNSLEELDLNNFDTSNVTDMSSMFSGCSSLKSLDLSMFDTGKVKEMDGMFSGCNSLTYLDVSSFNTSRVNTMEYMFHACKKLKTLDLSNFDTSTVVDMCRMFSECSSLKTVDLSSFDTSNVTDMDSMFMYCNKLISLDLSSFDTSIVTNMSLMFYDCASLTSLDISSFDTGKVKEMGHMFSECSSLNLLDVSSFDTSKVKNMYSMFSNCRSLESLDLSSFDTGRVTSMGSMFESCYSLTTINLNGFNTENVDNMSNMFFGCQKLITLDLTCFDTSTTTSMYGMFIGCNSLETLDLSSFETNDDTKLDYMFEGCYKLVSIKLGKGFKKWAKGGEYTELPGGISWTHGDLVKTSAELADEYPSHAAEWAGEWKRQMLPVTKTTAYNIGSGILVEWDKVKGATGYVVYRRAMKSGDTNWSAFARWNNTTDLSFLDTKVYEGTKYQYGIKAYFGSDPSTTQWLSPVGPMSTSVTYSKKPAAPTKTTTLNTDDGIQISWDTVKGAAGYVIYRRAWSTTTGGWTEFQRWNNTTSTKWTDTAVYAGTRYQYGIKAYYGSDPKNMTYVGSVGLLSTNVRITTRKITSLTASGSKVSVKWDASSIFTGYQVQYAGDSAFSDKTTISISNPKTTTVNINYTKGGECFVRVRSYHVFNGVTYYGAWSEINEIMIQ